MKNAFSFILAASLLTACGRTKTTQDNTTQSKTTQIDSVTTTRPESRNCQSLAKAGKLGKANRYQESAKPINVILTIDQDTTTLQTANGCYYNTTLTVLAQKKSGSRVFKRTLLKEDLLYFSKKDDAIQRAILQDVLYKPTFNGQKYITLTMRLMEPGSKRTTDYTVFMNYFGEIVKVK